MWGGSLCHPSLHTLVLALSWGRSRLTEKRTRTLEDLCHDRHAEAMGPRIAVYAGTVFGYLFWLLWLVCLTV